MTDRPAFDYEQTGHAIRCVCQWLDLRIKHGYAERYPATSIEAWHSGLLYRLLRGVEPFDEPPENSRRCLPMDFEWPEPTWVRREG